MKILKIIALSLGSLIALLGVGGYVFVKTKFTLEPNHLEFKGASNAVPIHWIQSKQSDIAALYLPIQFEGIPRTFYLQFDTGSPSTLLYRNSMRSIQEKYPQHIPIMDSTIATFESTFQLGDLQVHSKEFKIYDRNERPINWQDTAAIYKIGTLGADIIDQLITVMDFQNHCCYFGEDIPQNYEQNVQWYPLKYKLRKVQFPARVAGKKCNLLHDTGTSGFELITNKKTWEKLAKKGAKGEEAFKVRSWKRELTAFNIASDQSIEFETTSTDLDQITYIEGASFMQHALMRATGMGGMIGNQVFMGKVLILDCKERQYAVLE